MWVQACNEAGHGFANNYYKKISTWTPDIINKQIS